AKATSSTGTVLAKTGGQASKSGSLFSKFAGKLKFLAPIGSMLTGVMSTLLTALAALSAPVIIAVTVIGSLVAAFVVAYKKVGWFRDGINGLLYVFKVFGRSEERRVGKECRSGWWAERGKEKRESGQVEGRE